MRTSLAALLPLLILPALAAQVTVTTPAETMRLQSSSVTAGSGFWNVTLVMGDDNNNSALGSSFRRWWHCQINGLRTTGEQLRVQVTNSGYTDIILPVWALSTDGGQTFGSYQRAPLSATPTVSGTTISFTLNTPAGVTHLRLAKYFPYGVADRDRFLASLAGHPRVRLIQSLGTSLQNRTLPMVELTDSSVPDAGKHRVWIHSGIHPAETTSYFVVEGLIQFLLGGSPEAEILLDRLILDIVPMANPDGVALGNYRTNSQSSNLENEWASPYNSTQREIIALRTRIEQFMGTAAAPGGNPVQLLLNLHSTHGFAYPILYQHVANASFNLVSSRSGVVPSVNALEGQWIAQLRSRSLFTSRGTTETSTNGAPTRPFVESMMHDRWSIDPLWTGAPNFQAQIMAITWEGTYGKGPDTVAWNTPADYRQVGLEMALAMGDYFHVLPGASVSNYGTSCGGPALNGVVAQNGTRLDLQVSGAPVTPFGFLTLGATQLAVPLPPTQCLLRTDLLALLLLPVDNAGQGAMSLPIPAGQSLRAQLQFLAGVLQGPDLLWSTSNGLTLDAGR